MSEHLPPSTEVRREAIVRHLRECGCVACEAMLAVQRALDSDLEAETCAFLAGYLGGAAGVFMERAGGAA